MDTTTPNSPSQEPTIPSWKPEQTAPPPRTEKPNKNRNYIIGGIVALLLIGGGLLYYFLTRDKLRGMIVIPYIAHQKPAIDPHLLKSGLILGQKWRAPAAFMDGIAARLDAVGLPYPTVPGPPPMTHGLQVPDFSCMFHFAPVRW